MIAVNNNKAGAVNGGYTTTGQLDKNRAQGGRDAACAVIKIAMGKKYHG
jgi:hypothetical protein